MTNEEEAAKIHERGFKNGWEAAKDKFWAEGFDEGLKQAKKEEKEEE